MPEPPGGDGAGGGARSWDLFSLFHFTVEASDFERSLAFYQTLGFVLAGSTVWLGIRRGWSEVVNTGLVFALIMLFAKLFDWWWQLLPRYLFFLLLGLIAVLLLVMLQRWRRSAPGGVQ